jgi:hypothetical protein
MGLTKQGEEFFEDPETTGQAALDEIHDIRRALRARGVHVTSSGPSCDFCEMRPATHVSGEFFVCDTVECLKKASATELNSLRQVEGYHAER